MTKKTDSKTKAETEGSAEKKRALSAALASIAKSYKHGIIPATDANLVFKVNLDSPTLTYLFTGFSYDRIHCFYGPESSGKSTICTYIAGQLQKRFPERPMVVYIDFERSFDPDYATRLGLNCDENHLSLVRADCMEDAFQIAETLVMTEAVCCVIFDSDATAPSRTQVDNKYGEGSSFGPGAKCLSDSLRKFNIITSNYRTPLLVVSQERAQTQAMTHAIATTGGYAMRFYPTTRCRVTRLNTITVNGIDVGIHIRVRNVKNKAGIPWRDAEMDLYFDGGFDSDSEYFSLVKTLPPDGLVIKGSHYYWDKYSCHCESGDKFNEWLRQNPAAFSELKDSIIQKLTVSNKLDENNVVDENEKAADDAAEKAMSAPQSSSLAAEALEESPVIKDED